MRRTFLLIFFLFPALLFAINAPVTTAGSTGICPGASFSIPITVTGFTQITAITLRLDYDPTFMTYTGYSNVNPTIAGIYINQVTVSSTLYKIIVAWASVNPKTLANGSKLFDLNFTLISGSAVLSFNNTSGGGGDCEYADLNGNPMNDLPTESFYFNASITDVTVPAAGVITGLNTVCKTQAGVAYSIPAIAEASSYYWTVPPGATIVSGFSTNAITVDYSASASSGDITAAVVSSCGTGPSSSLFVTVNQPPDAAGLITGPDHACSGDTGLNYFTDPILNATSYAWTIPPGAVITSGIGTNSLVIDFPAGAVSGFFQVSGVNNCGNGTSSPSLEVTIYQKPSPPAITFVNDTLFSSSMEGNQWYLNQNLISGATASYFVPGTTGYYTCTKTLNGCISDFSNSIYVAISGVEESDDVKWMIFPNPNNGATNLIISAPNQEDFTIKVYNNSGTLVAEMKNIRMNYADECRIDLHYLPDGIYYIILIDEKHVFHQKIIVKN